MSEALRFWENKTLDELSDELSDEQWESLCDGCGKCCLQKLEDEDTGIVHYTDIACKLLDTNTCQCKHYSTRFSYVPDCLQVRPLTAEKLSWMPKSCAYVKLSNGEKLDDWHPLISGNYESVRAAGISVAGRCCSEIDVPVVEWPLHLID